MSFFPSCQEVQTELTEYAEGALPVSRKFGIWLHLALCHVCAGVLRGLKALRGLGKTLLAPPAVAPEAAARALAQVQAVLRKERP